jgi:hypothetical protein
MAIRILRLVVGIVVVLTAWTVGNLHGQGQKAEFEIYIHAPEGRTTLLCVKGCNWSQAETFFACGPSPTGCSSSYNQDGFFMHFGSPWATPPSVALPR